MWTLGRSWERNGYLGVLMLHGASPLLLAKQGLPKRLHAEAPGLGGTTPAPQPCPQPCPQDPLSHLQPWDVLTFAVSVC